VTDLGLEPPEGASGAGDGVVVEQSRPGGRGTTPPPGGREGVVPLVARRENPPTPRNPTCLQQLGDWNWVGMPCQRWAWGLGARWGRVWKAGHLGNNGFPPVVVKTPTLCRGGHNLPPPPQLASIFALV